SLTLWVQDLWHGHLARADSHGQDARATRQKTDPPNKSGRSSRVGQARLCERRPTESTGSDCGVGGPALEDSLDPPYLLNPSGVNVPAGKVGFSSTSRKK